MGGDVAGEQRDESEVQGNRNERLGIGGVDAEKEHRETAARERFV